ncbi:MAG: CPBP family intramembrane metalloprotease, partial [Planctomycetaceae bacterium]|nr:CPBP family intramembrane metalloprotease [Planctomycetaceae bacterium]
SPTVRIAFEDEKTGVLLRQILEEQPAEYQDAELSPLTLEYFIPEPDQQASVEEIVLNQEADLGIRLQVDQSTETSELELIGLEGPGNQGIREAISQRIDRWNLSQYRSQIFSDQISDSVYQQTFRFLPAPPDRSPILKLFPLVLLLMTVTGGVYPSIDLTAGERERNTMEALVAMPVSPFQILVSKYVAVIAVTLLTGLMNLAAMSITIYSFQLDRTIFGEQGLTISLLLMLSLVLVTFAIFFSAALLVVTSSAHSFKEAQAYLIPLLLVSIAPGLVIVFPHVELTWSMALAPVLNMLLLARDLFAGESIHGPGWTSLLMTLVYAAILLRLAAIIFGQDAIALGSRASWQQTFIRPAVKRDVSSAGESTFVLLALLPIYLFASGLMNRGEQTSTEVRLLLSGILTAGLFVLLPALVANWQRLRFSSAFRLQRTSLGAWPGVLLLGLSTWPLVFELLVRIEQSGISLFDSEKLEQMHQLLEAWGDVPVVLLIFMLGVIPGMSEEFFFRGFLFSGWRTRYSGAVTIVLTGLAFGLFHVILAGGLAPERVLPSTLLGCLLGFVSWRAGSIIPSILLHVMHNSQLLLIAHYREQLAQWQILSVEQTHLPTSWLLTAAGGFALGLILFCWGTQQSNEPVAIQES